ncbi:hypothetical protein GCM10011321_28390 [Youhaiella tibetensis]|nr:hypothetical protein GCM10011321_28390 [Youhaiella tibetensis]
MREEIERRDEKVAALRAADSYNQDLADLLEALRVGQSEPLKNVGFPDAEAFLLELAEFALVEPHEIGHSILSVGTVIQNLNVTFGKLSPSGLATARWVLRDIERGLCPRPYSREGRIFWHKNQILMYSQFGYYAEDAYSGKLFSNRLDDNLTLNLRRYFLSQALHAAPRDVLRKIEPAIKELERAVREHMPAEQLAGIIVSPEDEAEVPIAARRWVMRTKEERRGKGFLSASAFIRQEWSDALATGRLTEDIIDLHDPELIGAYKKWIGEHPVDRVKDLLPGMSPLERRVRSIGPDTPWDEIVKIAQAVVKHDHRRRSGKPSPKTK